MIISMVSIYYHSIFSSAKKIPGGEWDSKDLGEQQGGVVLATSVGRTASVSVFLKF